MTKVVKEQPKIDYSKIYSPSKLNLFIQCPQQYFFNYLDPVKMKMKTKLKQMPENIYPFHTLGKAIHNAVTLYYYLPLSQRTKKNLMKKLEEAWISEARWNKKPPLLQWGGFESIEEERGVYSEAIKMLRNFLKMAEENPAIHYLPTEDFRHSIKDYQDLIVSLNDDYDISGKFDLVVREGDRLQIVDFKTSKKEDGDQFQLRFYKVLAEEKFKKPVKKASFYFLKTGNKKEFDLEKEKTEEIKEEVLRRIDEIMGTENFETRPSKLCQFCLYQTFCPEKGKVKEVTKDLKKEDYSEDLPF